MKGTNGSENILLDQLKAYWKCRKSSLLSSPSPGMCLAEFDGIGCWKQTSAGHYATIACPEFVPGANLSQQVTRHCSFGGRWIKSTVGEFPVDYSACSFQTQQEVLFKALLQKILRDFSSLEKSPYDDPKISSSFDQCITNVLSKGEQLEGPHCVRTFDGWGCWNDTPVGQTAYIPCPSFIPGFLPERLAYKSCNSDGTWFQHPETNKTWSNYTTCVDQDDLLFRQRINSLYITGYTISSITLLASLFIFFYFKSLQCTRITVHKNLFLSFVINNIMWILWYTQVIPYPEVLHNNRPSCQLLHLLVHYFLMCNYFWMFCEGLHLHLLMVMTFVQDVKVIKWFYAIGWGLPVIFITIYATTRGKHPDHRTYCWIEDSPYLWLITGPVSVSLMINLIFLVNIVRVLVTKMQALNSHETHQTRKAVRATLILLPLLGLHYILTPFRPEAKSSGEAVYETISAVVTSFQGFLVALLFCFLNGEVIGQIKKALMQWKVIKGRERRISTYATATLSLPKGSASDISRRSSSYDSNHRSSQI